MGGVWVRRKYVVEAKIFAMMRLFIRFEANKMDKELRK
jgi:hypothetical protein